MKAGPRVTISIEAGPRLLPRRDKENEEGRVNRNGMKVMRKERRRDRRRGLNLEATLGGHEVLLTDLSAAGFGAALDATDRTPFSFRVGARMRLELTPQQGAPLSLPVEIIRDVGDNGVVGGVFVELTDAAYNAIETILTGRLQRRG
jgi:hypothetical protein